MTKSAVQMRGPVKIEGKTTVISGRVPEVLRRQLKAAAKKSGRSMSEELAWRAAMSFVRDEGGGLKAELRQAGYEPIGMDQGIVWAEPGVDWSRLSISIDAEAIVKEIQPELVQVFARALGKFAKTRKGDQ
jgi:hypothetical protein